MVDLVAMFLLLPLLLLIAVSNRCFKEGDDVIMLLKATGYNGLILMIVFNTLRCTVI